MNASNPWFPVIYAGETDSNGDVSIPVSWALKFPIRVSAIGLQNDRPCDNAKHELTMTLNTIPVATNHPFKGCDPVPPHSVSLTAKTFDLELIMTGFEKRKTKEVGGRAKIYYEPAVAIVRLPKTLTIPFKATAEQDGVVSAEATWGFPLDVTVTELFVGIRGPVDREAHRVQADLAADGGRVQEEFVFQGLPGATTGSLAAKGRAFRLKLAMDGFGPGTRVRGAILVSFDT